MTIDATTLKFNTTIVQEENVKKDSELSSSTSVVTEDAWLLSITSRYNKNALMDVERIMTDADVYDGTVEAEIDKIVSEADQISAVLKENTNVFNSQTITTLDQTLRATTAKTIGFVQYTAKSKINATTDTSSIKNSIVANNEKEKQLISDAIDTMIEWLDDYINNYNVRVAQGNNSGDSEVKLSFLLEIRKAIENCDFEVGFGTVGDTIIGTDENGEPIYKEDYQTNSNTLGSYQPNLQQYTNGKLVGYDTYHLNAPSRNIKLNPTYFMPDRTYTSLDELKAAVQNGASVTYLDLLVDDEAYNNYCKTNLATTLWHELIHSTHIYNEFVTYYATDAFEDDIADVLIEGFSTETMNYIKQTFVGLDNGVTYYQLGVTHYFDTYNQIADWAWQQISEPAPNGNKEAFDLYMPGVTKAECEAELKNFMATA